MIWLSLVLLFAGISLLATGVYMLGYDVGSDTATAELLEAQEDSLRARRAAHDLTRSAFVAMAEEAMRARGGTSS